MLNSDELQLLERYYISFKDLDSPKDFFVGLTDYIDFIKSNQGFDCVMSDLAAQGQTSLDKANLLGDIVLMKIGKVRNELFAYVSENKIENPDIQGAFKRYDDWLNGTIGGSQLLPSALYEQLRKIIRALHEVHGHEDFALQYMKCSDQDQIAFAEILPMKEYDQFIEAVHDYKQLNDTELWGQLAKISFAHDTIKHGKEKYQSLIDEDEQSNSGSLSWRIMNYGVAVHEWEKAKSGSVDLMIFNVKEVRPMVVRFHNYMLANSISALPQNKNIASLAVLPKGKEQDNLSSGFAPRLVVEKKVGYLQIFKQRPKLRLGQSSTRKFRLVQCLFSPDGSIDAQHTATFQKYERVYMAIRLDKDVKNSRLTDSATKRNEMKLIVNFAIKELQKIDAGKYLNFERHSDSIRMEITLGEGIKKSS